jgi:alanyl-tRNA synthetase
LSDELRDNRTDSELEKEESGFRKKLTEGELELLAQTRLIKGLKQSDAKDFLSTVAKITFDLFQTHGFPPELTYEYLNDNNDFSKEDLSLVNQAFIALLKEHQQKSRTASAGMFKGGLADNSEQTTKYHTAAHLMLIALKQVLGDQVEQKGSNINAERLRFDFNNPDKLTDEQIKKVEDIVNEQIQKSLPVTMQEMSLDEAKPSGAHGIFDDRYGNKVKVYTIGDPASPFSCEICGGPHVKNTSELGHFKIIKEESSSAGVRRIKAVLK